MKSIIIGNGINIQFGGAENTNKSIIDRALATIRNNRFDNRVYGKEIGDWLLLLHQNLNGFLCGEYDQFAVLGTIEEELMDFKKRYHRENKINEIGFEDYFLLHELFCRKNGIANPERYNFREILKRLFLDSIYNNGKVSEIHSNFPQFFIDFVNQYDSVFTTNYDQNITFATNCEVLHLHGAFHELADVYDPNSFRNKLSDRPVDKTPAIEGYEHAFSTALIGSSGALKQYVSDSQLKTNDMLKAFGEGYNSNPEHHAKINEWKNSSDAILKNLYEGITLKAKDPEQMVTIDYALTKLPLIEGVVTFMGLSPNNDHHIIETLNENEKVSLIEYFYFDQDEAVVFKSLFKQKVVEVYDIKEFWKNGYDK